MFEYQLMISILTTFDDFCVSDVGWSTDTWISQFKLNCFPSFLLRTWQETELFLTENQFWWWESDQTLCAANEGGFRMRERCAERGDERVQRHNGERASHANGGFLQVRVPCAYSIIQRDAGFLICMNCSLSRLQHHPASRWMIMYGHRGAEGR